MAHWNCAVRRCVESDRLPTVGQRKRIIRRLCLCRGNGEGERQGSEARVLRGHEFRLRIVGIRACGLQRSKRNGGLCALRDRKCVGEGKGLSVSEDRGGRRSVKKKKEICR